MLADASAPANMGLQIALKDEQKRRPLGVLGDEMFHGELHVELPYATATSLFCCFDLINADAVESQSSKL
jgi:hypothetical protein